MGRLPMAFENGGWLSVWLGGGLGGLGGLGVSLIGWVRLYVSKRASSWAGGMSLGFSSMMQMKLLRPLGLRAHETKENPSREECATNVNAHKCSRGATAR